MKETIPEYQQLGEFLNLFNKESDRGAALVAASILDEMLADILGNFFIDDKVSLELIRGANAPLSTFSSRLSAAYSLGLLQENEYREITLIRKIRNEFGHEWKEIDFKSQKIHDLCMNLPWLGPDDAPVESQQNARARFNFEVAILIFDLVWRSMLVKREKRINRVWPNKLRQVS